MSRGKYLVSKHILNLSINQNLFLENMKIACVTPIFKRGNEYLLTNYMPISVLACFSEILVCIMYNRVYDFLKFYMKNSLAFSLQIQPTMQYYNFVIEFLTCLMK